MKTSRHAAILGATIAAAGSAGAADFKAGDWDLSVGGIVNAFYTRTHCSGSQAVGGLAIATQALGCGGDSGRTVIGNGLLPNALITSVKGTQDGIDVGATLMIGAAASSDDAIGNNSNVDVRQGFLTFGTKDAGTVKLGRNYGLFGRPAILGDMTLFGAGAPVAATQRNRVTLGHIGAGYTYLGTYGQVEYALPTMSGFDASVALMSPVDASGTTYTGRTSPQLQAAASFAFTGGKVWAGLKSQKFDAPGGAGFTMNGAEIGGSASLDAFGLMVNLQSGKGIGVLSDGDSGPRKQTNVVVQGTFQATPKLKLGLNWGESRLRDGAVGTDLRSNSNLTGGLYFGLTKSLTLTAELSHTQSKDVAGDTAKLDGVAAGAILFF
ncbi:MAG TPA: porin [Burkholderiaceae bacterium]|nr:porin [Burkholderiaceae bacterium]